MMRKVLFFLLCITVNFGCLAADWITPLENKLSEDSVRIIFTSATIESVVFSIHPKQEISYYINTETDYTDTVYIPISNKKGKHKKEESISFDINIHRDPLYPSKQIIIPEKAKQMFEKYEELMDENGAIALADLMQVCIAGNIMYPTRCIDRFIRPMLQMDKYINSEEFIDMFKEEVYDGNMMEVQECTPSEYNLPDMLKMVCTTGKYETIDPVFEKAMIMVFRQEAGCTILNDGCGRTCFGICGKYYPQVYKETFSRADAEEIAYNNFYKKYKIDQLPVQIRSDVFYYGWGSGMTQAISQLQHTLGIPETGKIDSQTISSAQTYKGNLRQKYYAERWRIWSTLRDREQYYNGWAKAMLGQIKSGCLTPTQTPLIRNTQTTRLCDLYK